MYVLEWYKATIETAVKAAQVSGAKVQKLPYQTDGPSLSKADNAKTEAEANDMAKIPYRAIVGMLGHTKPDIAYALNVLAVLNQTQQELDVPSSWVVTVS